MPALIDCLLGLYHISPLLISGYSVSIMSDQNTTLQNLGSVGDTAYQTFVELPYRAFTTPRQAGLPAQDDKDMKNTPEKIEGHVQDDQFSAPVSDELLKLLTSPESVSTLLAQEPSLSPGEAWKKLYEHHVGKLGGSHSSHGAEKHLASEEVLRRAAEAGHWGPTQPSELFLRVSCVVSSRIIHKANLERCIMTPLAHYMMIPAVQWSALRSWEAVV